MKKMFFYLISSLLLSYTSNIDFSNPKIIVEEYYSHKVSGKLKKQYELIADTCKVYTTLQDYLEYHALSDSIIDRYKYNILAIVQLPIIPTKPNYRKFEIHFQTIDIEKSDTVDDYYYAETLNEKGKWKILWTKNIDAAAKKLYDSQKYDEAIKAYKESLMYNPLNGDTYFQMAWCFHRQTYTEKALNYAKKALELNPRNFSIYNLISGIQLSQGNYELAVVYINKAIELIDSEKQKDALYSNLSICYFSLNEIQKAKEAINKALLINPKNSHAWWQKGIIYSNLEGDSALNCFKKAIQFGPLDDFLQKHLLYDYAKTEYLIAINETTDVNLQETILRSSKDHILKAIELDNENIAFSNLLKDIKRMIN